MMRGVRPALLRLPVGIGYRMARALHIRKPMVMASDTNPAKPITNPTEAMVMTSANNGTEPPPPEAATAPADLSASRKGSSGGPLEVQMEGRSKRLRVRAAGDIWSDDFRQELARDRHFEASLAWRELVILIFIAIILAARSFAG
jgi:hypothetical protein